MDVRWSALLVMLVALGCGGGSSGTHPDTPAGGGDRPAATPAKGPLTEADCDRLLDHMFDVMIADRKKTAKPDEVPTEEDVAKARARLPADAKQKCIGSPRAPYDCSMKAQTTTEIRVCLEGGDQR